MKYHSSKPDMKAILVNGYYTITWHYKKGRGSDYEQKSWEGVIFRNRRALEESILKHVNNNQDYLKYLKMSSKEWYKQNMESWEIKLRIR